MKGVDNMPKKKSHDDFVKELYTVQPNIEVIGKYINTNTPLLCRCKIDGHEWSPRPKHLLSKHGCPVCGMKINSRQRTKTNDEFIKEFESKYPESNIEFLSEYIGTNEYINCKCKIDGHEWKVTAHNLLRGRNCPECHRRKFCGDTNPRWNPNITDEERKTGRNYKDYKDWRDSVFQRDNYTFQITGKQGKIVAHHIYSYDKHRELRLDIDNGITVLEEIHLQFHSLYGYGNNTFEQWNEFINSLK